MSSRNEIAGTAATVPANNNNPNPKKEGIMNQTLRTKAPEIKCPRCLCPPGDGEIFIDGYKMECPCHCHGSIPPADSPSHARTPDRHTIGGELARTVYGMGGLRDRIKAKRACTCEVLPC